MEKTKILIECETYVQTAIETYDVLRAFEQIANIEVSMKLTSAITRRDIGWCDILYSIRSTNILSTYFAKICKSTGRLHIVLLDDYLFNVERTDYFMKKRQGELGRILNITDVLFSTNQLLIDKMQEHYSVGKAVRVDTAVKMEDIKTPKCCGNDTIKKIAYYSNDGTNHYFASVILPIMETLTNQKQFEIEIHCIGMHRIADSECRGIKYVPHLSLKEFREYLSNQGFSLGVAPIVKNNGFSEYKYFNKFIEFSMAGIPGIYTNAYPYTGVIIDGENGFLCDSEKEWTDCIIKVLNDDRLREKIIYNAQEQLKSDFSIQGVYSSIKRQFPDFDTYKAPKVRIPNFTMIKVKYVAFCVLEKVNSVYRAFKRGGIKGFLDRSRQYFMLKKQTQRKEWEKV